VNPALQGYLAAMEESLDAAGALADAATEMGGVADLVDGNARLMLALDDGSVPVASRRAVLDHLLEGRVRPEVRGLVHQAVTVVPASELTASFHWLATRLAHAAVLALRDGSMLDLKTLKKEGEGPAAVLPEREHPLVTLFAELETKFKPGRIPRPVSFYFTLGGDDAGKLAQKPRIELARRMDVLD